LCRRPDAGVHYKPNCGAPSHLQSVNEYLRAELNLTQHLVAFQLFSLLIVLLLEAPILIAAWVLFKVTYPPTTSMRQRIGLLVNPIASVPLAILLLLVAYGSQVSFLEPPNALFFT
jgi:hypothetical protein